jgi:mannosyltransferase OCH1-like enzyme
MEKTLHRIWLGNEMPEDYKEYGRLWKAINPGWTMKLWTESDIFSPVSPWRNQLIIDKMIEESKQPGADMVAFWTHVADVVCPEIVWRYGGVYINTDMKPLKPLIQLSVDWDLPWLAMEDDRYAVNMAMYSPGRDEFFNQAITTMPRRYFGSPGAFMNFSTGALLYEEVLSRYRRDKVQLINRKVFNPIHFTDFGYGERPDLDREFGPETIAVHAWGHRTNQRGQTIL